MTGAAHAHRRRSALCPRVLRQARHDLEDAEILRAHGRWAGTAKSAQAAVEKAIKAALFLSRGRANVPRTHHVEKWLRTKRLGKRLRVRIQDLESQVPSRYDNRNPEYPFGDILYSVNPIAPSESYTNEDASVALETAQRAIRRLRAIYRTLE